MNIGPYDSTEAAEWAGRYRFGGAPFYVGYADEDEEISSSYLVDGAKEIGDED